jgi:Flp pilus assembly pilin Flp
MKTFNQFCHDETAATATEYALLLAAIAGLLLVSLIFMGNESGTFWGSTANSIETISR